MGEQYDVTQTSLPPWRRIVFALCVKRLPSNAKAMKTTVFTVKTEKGKKNWIGNHFVYKM